MYNYTKINVFLLTLMFFLLTLMFPIYIYIYIHVVGRMPPSVLHAKAGQGDDIG